MVLKYETYVNMGFIKINTNRYNIFIIIVIYFKIKI